MLIIGSTCFILVNSSVLVFEVSNGGVPFIGKCETNDFFATEEYAKSVIVQNYYNTKIVSFSLVAARLISIAESDLEYRVGFTIDQG